MFQYLSFNLLVIKKTDTWHYEGETDDAGLACGYGVGTNVHGNTYKGTWFEDKIHGVGILKL